MSKKICPGPKPGLRDGDARLFLRYRCGKLSGLNAGGKASVRREKKRTKVHVQSVTNSVAEGASCPSPQVADWPHSVSPIDPIGSDWSRRGVRPYAECRGASVVEDAGAGPIRPGLEPAADHDFRRLPPPRRGVRSQRTGQIALMQDEETLEFLRRVAPGCRLVTSVCTGSLVLGAAWLLAGYRATCHWSSIDQQSAARAGRRKSLGIQHTVSGRRAIMPEVTALLAGWFPACGSVRRRGGLQAPP
jgi:hypothetical protein